MAEATEKGKQSIKNGSQLQFDANKGDFHVTNGMEVKKYPYPKSVYFIISTEFCERFSFYGMKTILALFFNQILRFSEDKSTIWYHAFTALCYFTPIFGAIMADSFLGKFRTIFYLSIVYAMGQIILTVGAVGDTENGNQGIEGLPATAISFLGLFLIAVGTGGIKPCVSSFGGEQFKLPEQQRQLNTFFSLFYASINSGSLISTVLTPILRQDVSCMGQITCYPLAFGVPAALMVLALFIFLIGRVCHYYIMQMPKENIILKTCSCYWYVFRESQRRKREKLSSWMDYAVGKYEKSFVSDVKALNAVLLVFIPFPVYWALFDQQGSRWTFQATRMDGNTFGYEILPDQMQVSNPLLILAFIPIFDYIVYPISSKIGILRTPLQRMVTGGFLCSLSFVISGLLELKLQQTYPKLPGEGETHLVFYNGLSADMGCEMGTFDVVHTNSSESTFQIDMSNITEQHLFIIGQVKIKGKTVLCNDGVTVSFPDLEFYSPPAAGMVETNIHEDNSQSVLFSLDLDNLGDDLKNLSGIIRQSYYRSRIEKSETGLPYVKILWNIKSTENLKAFIIPEGEDDDPEKWIVVDLNTTMGDSYPTMINGIGKTKILIENIDSGKQLISQECDFYIGANYQILFQYDDSSSDVTANLLTFYTHEITDKNSMHIMWLLPQFIVMTMGEILFSITSLQFSFTQAPETMKAVMMSVRLLTNAFGNVIDVVLISLLEGVFGSQAYEFFLFAGLMFVDVILLWWIAMGYTYVDFTTGNDVNDNGNKPNITDTSISYDMKEYNNYNEAFNYDEDPNDTNQDTKGETVATHF